MAWGCDRDRLRAPSRPLHCVTAQSTRTHAGDHARVRDALAPAQGRLAALLPCDAPSREVRGADVCFDLEPQRLASGEEVVPAGGRRVHAAGGRLPVGRDVGAGAARGRQAGVREGRGRGVVAGEDGVRLLACLLRGAKARWGAIPAATRHAPLMNESQDVFYRSVGDETRLRRLGDHAVSRVLVDEGELAAAIRREQRDIGGGSHALHKTRGNKRTRASASLRALPCGKPAAAWLRRMRAAHVRVLAARNLACRAVGRLVTAQMNSQPTIASRISQPISVRPRRKPAGEPALLPAPPARLTAGFAAQARQDDMVQLILASTANPEAVAKRDGREVLVVDMARSGALTSCAASDARMTGSAQRPSPCPTWGSGR